jgi:superfamily I DNA and/or RNA helicase
VLSNDAARLGLNRSILEIAITKVPAVFLLNTQYRMKPSIAGFSSQYFYNDLLLTADHLVNTGTHLTFIDTAGSGYEEKRGNDGTSLQNEGELLVLQKLLETEELEIDTIAVISPYAGQVTAARERLDRSIRVSTIDSFQGQEKEVIIVSLVRSNDEGEIGFLKDYRRMNVALTRAKEKLYVIGDSATLGADPFYNSFLGYVEKHGSYRSIWEFELT